LLTRVAKITAIAAWIAIAVHAQESTDPTRKREALVGPEDTVNIVALNCEEISKAWRVGVTGDLHLPLIGKVHAAGLTVEELEGELTAKLKRYVKQPEVVVYVSELRSHPVTVTGAVQKPGIVQLDGSETLFQAIVGAGGPTKEAGASVTVKRSMENGPLDGPTVRSDKDGTYTFVDLPLDAVIDGRGAAAELRLKADDIVSVPVRQVQRLVHVTGDVGKPGSVELLTQNVVSLIKLVALAGGPNRTAALGKTVIIHINEQGVQTSVARVDLKKILNGSVKDLELTNGDIVIVPSSQLKSYAQAASVQAVTSGVYSAMFVLATL
jgi:protein involved in polysaccharide export with SLBB domain